ncbi:hypothetical protein DL1_00405 [Thioclava dalianensis]|uniref:Uncharacterized protein n=1 Tax=Thioclava dalianensis TaxID=1185766 RepID=A0A074TNP7_9RHOB|nr:hypothetical protein [Thioclava dalianensis]KEP71765.1 hypothetical protein DL1_00405 [Thioclava dalianensis]SFN65299.1 hypothetical protein SAMN05216224_108146 [Thioclava dalianensis]
MTDKRISYAVRDFTVPPGATISAVRDAGFVSCLDASDKFKISFDDGTQNDFEAGLTYRPAAGFTRLAIHNPNENTLTVRLGLGKGNIADARVTISAGNTLATRERNTDLLTTPAPVSAANGATTLLAGADDLRREIMVVSPTDAGGAVFVAGSADAVSGQGVPILPGQAITLSTGAAVYLRNDTGAAVNIAVAEMGWSV